METFFESLNNIFSISYIFSNIIIIYIIIEIFKKTLKKNISCNYKKILTVIISSVIGVIYVNLFEENSEIIFCSAIASIVFYDYLIKFILKKFKKVK